MNDDIDGAYLKPPLFKTIAFLRILKKDLLLTASCANLALV